MYLRFPEDTGIYMWDPAYCDDPTPEEEFRCSCGIALAFPASQTVAHEDALQVARLYFATGRLSDVVHWDFEDAAGV